MYARDAFNLTATVAIWITAGVVNIGCEGPSHPEVHDRPAVFDVMPSYSPPGAGEPLLLTVDEMRAAQLPGEITNDEPFAAFKLWKSNTDPRASGAGIRRWLREQDQR